MKRNTKEKLEQSWKDINALSINRPTAVRLFAIYGGSRDMAVKAYQAREQAYTEYLKKNNLINPGISGVPSNVALPFLKMYGITKESIKEALEAEERA